MKSRQSLRPPDPLTAILRDSTDEVADLINIEVAAFSAKLVHGEVSDERRPGLLRISPDFSPDAVALRPALQEMMRVAHGFVFVGLSFTAEEQKILPLIYKKIGFSPFSALLKLLGRLPRVDDQLVDLVALGARREDVVAALLMVPEELQAAIAEHLPEMRKRLGQRLGSLRNYPALGRKLRFADDVLEPIERAVEDKLTALHAMQNVIQKFLDRTKHLLRGTKSPLVRLPRIKVAHVLIQSRFERSEAFKRTAALLRAWHPYRFVSLTSTQVRLSYQRAVNKTLAK
jgi:hypothetical protein